MRPTYLNPPAHYTREEFLSFIRGLKWGGWEPLMPYVHNTGVPSLKQWLALAPTPQERWASNLISYYKGLGWHAGPHAVACPDYIWALCDFTEPGVAESCSNAVAWAIEMVGDYRTGGDDPTSGPGAKVVDNACWAIACMAETVEGWGDLSDYAFNKKGLHFHRECRQDHHACPGDLVDKKAMLAMIAKHRATIRGVSAPAPLPRAPSHLFDLSHNTGWQQALKSLHFDIVVDGDFGPKSSTVLEGFQKCAGLKPNGIRTTKTRDSLTKAAG